MSDTTHVNNDCLILMAHGSRNPNWLAPFKRLADQFKGDASENRVQLCFMEIASPSLEEVAQQLHGRGVKRARLLPLFLASGTHLVEDVPGQLRNIEVECPGLQIDLLPPIGENAAFAELLYKLVQQYL